MRKAIDGFAAIVQKNFELDVFSESLFLFCGKRCDPISNNAAENAIRSFTVGGKN